VLNKLRSALNVLNTFWISLNKFDCQTNFHSFDKCQTNLRVSNAFAQGFDRGSVRSGISSICPTGLELRMCGHVPLRQFHFTGIIEKRKEFVRHSFGIRSKTLRKPWFLPTPGAFGAGAVLRTQNTPPGRNLTSTGRGDQRLNIKMREGYHYESRTTPESLARSSTGVLQ